MLFIYLFKMTKAKYISCKAFVIIAAHKTRAILAVSGVIWQGAHHSMNFWSQQGDTPKQDKIASAGHLLYV